MKKTVDIFCDIIDNFGDIGVVFRLAKELNNRGFSVRIFTNKMDEVSKIIKFKNDNFTIKNIQGILILDVDNCSFDYSSELIIEAFATDLPKKYLDILSDNSKLIINLEYLSAEEWVEDCHLKNSFSPKSFIEKVFFIPGLKPNSGGVLLDEEYLSLSESFVSNRELHFNNFFSDCGLKYNSEIFYVNVFTYSWDFLGFVEELSIYNRNFMFFVLDNKLELPKKLLNNVQIIKLDYMEQSKFDKLMNLSDFNFIRGEDSFVRGLLTGKPFLWNIYPQEDLAHLDKLEAFLSCIKPFFKENYDLYYKLNFKLNENLKFSDLFMKFIEMDSSPFIEYKKYLEKNCNLVEKLLYFIDSRLNQNQEEI